MERSAEIPEISRYLSALGLHHVNDLEDEILRVFGREQGGRLVARISDLFDEMDRKLLSNRGRDPAILRQDALVDLINSDPQLSLIFASYYDRAVLRRLLKYLECCAPFLGEHILDMGSGNGIVTGYLARLCPSSRIVGAEVSQSARDRAALLCRDFPGVSFTCEPEANGFDTVISFRTWHENMAVLPEEVQARFSGQELTDRYAALAGDYAGFLASRLKRGGYLLTAERVVSGEQYGGILAALKAAGFSQTGIDEEACVREFSCVAGDAYIQLRTGVFRRD